MTEIGGDFGDPMPDRALRRRLREESARELPMGVAARTLLKPFATAWYVECVKCGRDLTDPGCTYYVERALRGDEPLFEFALCEACVYDVEDEFSAESRAAIERFMLLRFDLDDRQERLASTADGDALVERCLMSGAPRVDLEEYQVWAWCRDGRFVADPIAPALVSSDVLEEIADRLSRATRDAMDDFVRDHLGLPPELHRLPVLV